MMRRLWCEKAEVLPTGGTPREVRRRSGARLSRGVVARESARERGLPRASFASSSFSTFSGRRAFGSAAGLSRENPVGSWRVPHLSSSLSFLAMSMAPPKAAVAICAGGGGEGGRRVRRPGARFQKRRANEARGPGDHRASSRRRGGPRSARVAGNGVFRVAIARGRRARGRGGFARTAAPMSPGTSFSLSFHHFLSVSSSAIVVRSGRGSSGSLSFAPGFVARRRRSGRRSRATTPILVGRGSLRLGRNDRRRDGGASETTSLGGFERAFRELPDLRNVRELQKRRPCLGGVRRRVPPPPPAAGPGVVLARVDGTVRELPDDRGRGHVPPARARSERRREGVTPPRVSRARDGVSRLAVRDETALPESSPSPASASRDPDPSMPP